MVLAFTQVTTMASLKNKINEIEKEKNIQAIKGMWLDHGQGSKKSSE